MATKSDDPDILLVMPSSAAGEYVDLQVSAVRTQLYVDIVEARSLVCETGELGAGGLATVSVKTSGRPARVADLVRGVEILVQVSGRCVFGATMVR